MTEPITLTANGLTVTVAIKDTEYGPKLVLGGVNCDLEGDMPGEYYLVAASD